MKMTLFHLILFVFAFSSCNSFRNGKGDLLYKLHRDVPGTEIQEGDIVVWTAVERTEEGAVTFSWYNSGTPALYKCEKPVFKGDLFTALGLLSEGDSATFKISIDSLVAHTGRIRPNTKSRYLLYDIRIDKVFHKAGVSDSLFVKEVDNYLNAELDKMKSEENLSIQKYIISNNLDVKVTPSGLIYSVMRQGTGKVADVTDTVVVNYTGILTNGRVFDTTNEEVARKTNGFEPYQHTFNGLSHPYVPVKVPIGFGRAVAGFEEALTTFSKGTRVILIIPSKLAFNQLGEGKDITPYTPLVYDLEIVDILHPTAGLYY